MSTKSDTQFHTQQIEQPTTPVQIPWYRSPWYNALILGLCNFLAPGIWNAMNSLGGGGDEEPYLVNAANALTFGLMVISCLFMSGPCVRYIGIKWTLILGTIGYAPYAAGLYTHNRYGDGWSWFILFGAALCGLSAGLFWMAEAAIALSYPEPERQGRFLGLWLSFRVGGQVLGGAVNLGLNAHRNKAGSVSYAVLIVFIVLQALGPFVGLLVSSPERVLRTDGQQVHLQIHDKSNNSTNKRSCFWLDDLRAMTTLFLRPGFLAIIPLIAQAAYAEAVMFTYEDLWFSVRARALGSFLSGILALSVGNILGAFLDMQKLSLKLRTRSAFIVILALQGGWWLWATVITTEFRRTQPVYDWVDPGFGKGFALFLVWVAGFQLNYMFLFFVIGILARNQEEIIRYAGLLRGTESAVQAVSVRLYTTHLHKPLVSNQLEQYGLSSVPIMASVGSIYLNFGLWAVSLLPAWWVIKKFGVTSNDEEETG